MEKGEGPYRQSVLQQGKFRVFISCTPEIDQHYMHEKHRQTQPVAQLYLTGIVWSGTYTESLCRSSLAASAKALCLDVSQNTCSNTPCKVRH